jgi:hypothetical protein
LIGAEPPSPLYACNDGIDNDGDGFADKDDVKCVLLLEDNYYCPFYDSETDPITYTSNEDMATLGCYQI